MSRRNPYVIELSEEERRVLEDRAAQYTSPYRDVVRARIALMAAEGLRNDQIARIAAPFDWTFTRDDLAALIARSS